ncbi:helix-turn-helix domain-containing protein [Chryseobacterium nepalense]|uniref:helix-turn-helix domain-containing protein n=1 Tax=Chryseobacterium nepalense TaxID=1854498 RepID=UPI002E08AD21|nr:excisionase family DNA binding protein [Chryseobacterium nepalense]
MEILTFEQLPKAVTMLTKEVSELKRLLIKKQEQPTIDQPDQLLTIQEAAEFLSLTVPTMYSKVSKREIPCMKRSKRLYFSRTELLEYLKEGRKKSNTEIEAEAEAYLLNPKKKAEQWKVTN